MDWCRRVQVRESTPHLLAEAHLGGSHHAQPRRARHEAVRQPAAQESGERVRTGELPRRIAEYEEDGALSWILLNVAPARGP